MKLVLLVDDDAAFLESLKDGLEQYADRINYLTAADGEEALELLGKNDVATLVTDLRMPGLNGHGLLTRVMEKNPEIPCIVMTAHGSAELERTFDVHSIEYVEKPIDIDHLHRVIVKMVGRWGQQGKIKGVDLSSFVQMVEMERKTCRVEVYRSLDDGGGVLVFVEGRLHDAELDGLAPRAAALEILAWRDVYIRVGMQRGGREARVKAPLMELMMEAARRADEGRRGESSERGACLDVLDDSLSEAEPGGPADDPGTATGVPGNDAEVPRIVLEGGAMRGLNDLLERFVDISGFEGVAVYSSDGELKGFFLPVSYLSRLIRGV
jgi:CheY-like chemotaxis protein